MTARISAHTCRGCVRCIKPGTLAGGGDVLSSARLEQFLGSADLRRRVAVNGKQSSAVLHSSLVPLRLILRNAHANQGPDEAAHSTTHTKSGQSGHNRSSSDKRAHSGNREGSHPCQHPQRAANDAASSNAGGSSFRRLRLLNVRELLGAAGIRQQNRNAWARKARRDQRVNCTLGVLARRIDSEDSGVFTSHKYSSY